ncbi:MAG: pseudouridine synthase [Pseudomonadota bacterium]
MPPKKQRSPIRQPQNKKPASKKGEPLEELAPTPRARRARSDDTQTADAPKSQRPRIPRNDTPAEESLATESTSTEKLHKVLAQAGLGSRRDMEAAIEAGRVSVNGHLAKVGDRVAPNDRILLDSRPVKKPKFDELPRILVYHKPEGEIVSRDDPDGRTTVFDKLPRVHRGKWISIGRLDYNTSGLLIFTTSGELANKLSHPRFEMEREYAVRVMGELSTEQCQTLCNGIELEDGPAKFEWLREDGGESTNRWYRVMLREGRNREIRRMFESMGIMVSRLMRVRFGIVNLPPRLKRGGMLELDVKQVKSVLDWAEIPIGGSTADSPVTPGHVQTPQEKRPVPRNPYAGRTQNRMRTSGGKK